MTSENTDIQFSPAVIESFYLFEKPNWQTLSEKSGLSPQDCQNQWRALSHLSQTLSRLEDKEASSITLNRLSALAREACQNTPVPFWQKLVNWKMAFASTLTILVALVGFQTFQGQIDVNIALNDFSVDFAGPLKKRMMTTTLDQYKDFPTFAKNKSRAPQFNSFSKASPVSLNSSYDFASNWDDELFKENLSAKQLETLFYRAHKFERQGYYREALKDYQFIAEFYPRAAHPQLIHIAMARCLEGLDQKDEALKLLDKSAKTYGASDELQIMVEQLRTKTF